MTPKLAKFYVYCESDAEIRDLQDALFQFVNGAYERGICVTATRITDALKRYGNSPIVSQFLK